MELEALGQRILEEARRQGATEAEVFLQQASAITIDVRDQAVDVFKEAEDVGVGLRVLQEGRLGFAFSSDFSRAGLSRLVDSALVAARCNQPDEYNCLPDKPAGGYPTLHCFDEELARLSVREKVELAREVEAAAYEHDPRVRRVRHTSYRDAFYRVCVVNSRGVEVSFQGSMCSLAALVIAEENGEAQSGWDMDNAHFLAGLKSAREVGRAAAQAAVGLLGGRRISSCRATVVFDPLAGCELWGELAAGFLADAVQKGKSLFCGRLGEEVASKCVTLVDDGLLQLGMAAAPADSEGVPMQRTVVVDKGILRSFLYDGYTAAKEGSKSTGNGVRHDFKLPPGVGVTNFFVFPGEVTREKLLADTPSGLYVTQVMGAHTIDAVSGDFSVGVAGFWLEQGEPVYPVCGVTISGNVLELLQRIDLVANDLRFVENIGSPTLRVCDIIIGGV